MASLNIIIRTAFLAALLTLMATEMSGQRISANAQVIDCGQVVFKKPVTAHFELINEGEASLTIKDVETSCGCTEVNYPKGLITANKPFVVSATYDAKQMGRFEKYIDVYTNGASLPFTLTMKGVVVEELRDFGGEYEYVLGKIKADKKDIVFDDVNKGENPTAEIHLLNTTSDVVKPVILKLPKYMKASVSPSSIPPGKAAVLTFTLESKKLDGLGLSQDKVYLGLSPTDKATDDKEISLQTIMLPSFGLVTDQQLLYSPKIKVSETTLDLGKFENKKKKKVTVVIENLGRTDLEIMNMQLYTVGIESELSTNVIHPGESAKLRITADKKTLKGVKEQPKILLITNDPRTPKVIIDVNVQ